MVNIWNNVKENIINSLNRFHKIRILIFLMVFFSLLYMLLDDSHFEGVNKFKEIVKEEVIKKKAQQEIVENYANLEDIDKSNSDLLMKKYYKPIVKNEKPNIENKEQIKEEKVLDQATKETEKEVKETELEPEQVKPSPLKKYMNRLYFAIVTGCLLGYGDIYPVSNTSKLLAGLQGLLTVCLIIY